MKKNEGYLPIKIYCIVLCTALYSLSSIQHGLKDVSHLTSFFILYFLYGLIGYVVAELIVSTIKCLKE